MGRMRPETEEVRKAILRVLYIRTGAMTYEEVARAIRRTERSSNTRSMTVVRIAAHASRMREEGLLHVLGDRESRRLELSRACREALPPACADGAPFDIPKLDPFDGGEIGAVLRALREARSDELPRALWEARKAWMQAGAPGLEG